MVLEARWEPGARDDRRGQAVCPARWLLLARRAAIVLDNLQCLGQGVRKFARFLDAHDLPDGNFYKMEGGFGTKNNQGPTASPDNSDINAFQSGMSQPLRSHIFSSRISPGHLPVMARLCRSLPGGWLSRFAGRALACRRHAHDSAPAVTNTSNATFWADP